MQRELRALRQVNLKSAVEQFRLGSLEARFNSISELFGRRLREREEGRGTTHPAAAAAAPRPLDPQAGIVLDQRLDPEAVDALFAGLVRSGGGARLELDSFRTHLRKQLDTIRERTGAERAQFRLALEEGKLKLKAKPVGGLD